MDRKWEHNGIMAHFAKLDENNVVIEVNVVSNSVLDANNEEQSGINFLIQWSGGYSNWKQTSYNNNFRGTYAGIGYSYDANEDIFIAPKPYPSWIRSGSFWNPPTPMPTEGRWSWDESSLSWVESTIL
jgi:hypothetical protein